MKMPTELTGYETGISGARTILCLDTNLLDRGRFFIAIGITLMLHLKAVQANNYYRYFEVL